MKNHYKPEKTMKKIIIRNRPQQVVVVLFFQSKYESPYPPTQFVIHLLESETITTILNLKFKVHTKSRRASVYWDVPVIPIITSQNQYKVTCAMLNA